MTLPRVLASVLLWAGLCGTVSATESDRDFDCVNPIGTMQSDLCAADVADAADAELNATYAQVREQLRAQAADRSCTYCGDAEKQLIAAQRAWIQLRDHDCDAVYAFNADGTSRNGAKMRCLTTLARDRSRQLRDFYELL